MTDTIVFNPKFATLLIRWFCCSLFHQGFGIELINSMELMKYLAINYEKFN